MNPFWSAVVQSLTPYVPGEQPKVDQLIKLNTNESPFGPSPKAVKAMRAEIGDNLRLYPDPEAERLKEAIAHYYRVERDQVFVGNGSDEVLAHAFQALLQHPKPVLFPDVSYSFYPVYCKLYGIQYREIPLRENFELNVRDYRADNGGVVIANPNAPSGRLLALAEIEELLAANMQSAVIIDEAYIDFGGTSAIALLDQYPNLLVIQTFSKSRALAGLRVGFAIGDRQLIEALERVKNSFNSYPLDRIAISGAVAALEDEAYFQQMRQTVIDTRERLVEALTQLGCQVIPSAANFIFVKPPQLPAEQMAAKLREHNVLVRHFSQPQINRWLRISVGSQEQCEALIQALKDILGL